MIPRSGRRPARSENRLGPDPIIMPGPPASPSSTCHRRTPPCLCMDPSSPAIAEPDRSGPIGPSLCGRNDRSRPEEGRCGAPISRHRFTHWAASVPGSRRSAGLPWPSGRTVRWGLAATAVAALVLLAYLAASPLTTASNSYLASGRRFSSDDLIKVSRRSTACGSTIGSTISAGSPWPPTSSRRPRGRSPSSSWARVPWTRSATGRPRSSVWESFHDREVREHQRQAKILEIADQRARRDRGLVRPDQPPQGAAGSAQTAPRPSAFVRLETEGDRQLPFRTIQSITTNLTGAVPGPHPRVRSPSWIAGATSISTPAIRPSAPFPTAGPAKKS